MTVLRKVGKGSPRTTISICHDLVEFAVSDLGPGERIDARFATKFLSGKSYS